MATDSIKTATFEELWSAWPREGRSDFLRAAGGALPDAVRELTDDSAARLSAAFNRTGHPIPKSTLHTGVEIKDAHGLKYMTSVAEMKAWLQSKLGQPRHMASMSNALGRKGILLFEGGKLPNAAGHLEMWDGQATADTTGDYWHEAANVLLWELHHHHVHGVGGHHVPGVGGHHSDKK